jgi:N-acetylneuraminic acid mutarotase
LLLILLSSAPAFAQTYEWIWVGGDTALQLDGSGQAGVYGSLGMPDPANKPGGRDSAVQWKDADGNFWLFGGFGFLSPNKGCYLNDLWKFDVSALQWTWMSGGNAVDPVSGACPTGNYGTLGRAADSNLPPGRKWAMGWTDTNGNLWLFGGQAADSSSNTILFNDLWEFNVGSGQWTWMGGSSTQDAPSGTEGSYGTKGQPSANNVPGARHSSVAWTDASGNFWLFGGTGFDSVRTRGFLNDLWEYTASTGEWTWVTGASTVPVTSNGQGGQNGNYGARGTFASTNTPGGRTLASGWTDAQGNLYLFGGVGYTPTSTSGPAPLNDVWEFQQSSQTWVWQAGSENAATPGTYGTLGVASTANFPGARFLANIWVDENGKLWMFGGFGNGLGLLNDLWEIDTSNGKVAWMGGSQSANQPGIYGTLDTPDAANVPGSRDGAASWIDNSGNLWMFGGWGYDSGGVLGDLNDFWVYHLPAPLPAAATPQFNVPSGTYTTVQTVTITDATPGATILYSTDGGNTVNTYTGPITVSSSETIVAVARATGYNQSAIATVSYTVNLQTPTPILSVPSGTYGSVLLSISDAENGAAIHYTLDGSTPTKSSPSYSGSFQIASSETVQAIAIGTLNGETPSDVAGATYVIDPTAASTAEWVWLAGESTLPNPDSTTPNGNGREGFYGQLGVPSKDNLPGGRDSAVSWTDPSGTYWLFGGEGFDSAHVWGYLNDLWKFNPATQTWAWMSGSTTVPGLELPAAGSYGKLGVAAASNVPSGRTNAVSWVDAAGNLWLFGGAVSNDSGNYDYNDLWMYNTSTAQWTWMSGSQASTSAGSPGVYGAINVADVNNVPGARDSALAWTDAGGNLWLFGGEGIDSATKFGYLNDLWMFNTTTSQWTWVAGSSAVGAAGIIGSQTEVAAGNTPGARFGPNGWKDASGNFWLFGGVGKDTNGTSGFLNDLWEFSPTTGQWAFVAGNATVPSPKSGKLQGNSGVYGTLGSPSDGDFPGGRYFSTTWIDASGMLWLMGGYGFDSTGAKGLLNDLWTIDPNSGSATWMSGATSAAAPGLYGAKGVPSAGAAPGARYSPVSWIDATGDLWLMGGGGLDIHGTYSEMNDVWVFQPTGNALPAATPYFNLNSGTYGDPQQISLFDLTPGATIYYTTDGSPATTKSPAYSGPFEVSTTTTVNAIAVAPGYAASAPATAKYTYLLAQTISFPGPRTPMTYTPASIQLSATSTSGLPVSFKIVSGPGALNGNLLSVRVGSIMIAADQAGNDVYAPAPEQVFTLVVNQATPAITWNAPAPITYGAALDVTELNASAGDVKGSYQYSPDVGAILKAGKQTLSVTFAPTDTADYTIATASVTLQVNQATPAITWNPPAPITYGTALSATQLSATANTGGKFTYSPLAGAVLKAGKQTLSVTFAPTDTTDYTSANASVTLQVNQATPKITWATPAAITYGTALSATQLSATANTGGTFTYSPLAGAVLKAGKQTLRVTFAPTDTTDYTPANASVTVQVNQASPRITWATPAAITYGTPLGAAQLDASASVGGKLSYSPAAGFIPKAGKQALTVAFTPTDAVDYTSANSTVTLVVNQAVPAVTLKTSTSTIAYGASLTLTATAAAVHSGIVPTGTVTFLNGATILGKTALTASGAATFVVAALPGGKNSITASYGGDVNYAQAVSPAAAVTVTKVTPAITLAASPTSITVGAKVTLTATLKGVTGAATPAGTVVFAIGTTKLGTGTLVKGVASLAVTSLPVGTDSIIAGYLADGNYNAVTSKAVTVTVKKK